MILVTGGAFQGKQEFAEDLVRQRKKNQSLTKKEESEVAIAEPESIIEESEIAVAKSEVVTVEGEYGSWQQFLQADVIAGFHLWIWKLLKEEKEPFLMIRELLKDNPKVVITLNQVGCGIVPMEAFDRQYREMVGRIGCLLAEQAEEVYLLNCGIAKRIK